MNILIAQDANVAYDLLHDYWAEATSFFGGQRLMQCIAALAVIQPSIETGENLNEAIDETIETLISTQIDHNVQSETGWIPSDQDRRQVAQYLRDSVACIRPYMPDSGSMELVTYLTDPTHETLYLVIRYWPDDGYSDKAFTSPSVRG